jgi:hypothetical protein
LYLCSDAASFLTGTDIVIVTHRRGHIDDAAVALALHTRHEGPAHQERAGEIRADRAVPCVQRESRHVPAKADGHPAGLAASSLPVWRPIEGYSTSGTASCSSSSLGA